MAQGHKVSSSIPGWVKYFFSWGYTSLFPNMKTSQMSVWTVSNKNIKWYIPGVQIRRGLWLSSPQYLTYNPTKPYVVGTQKNSLIETILLSTYFIGLADKIRNLEQAKSSELVIIKLNCTYRIKMVDENLVHFAWFDYCCNITLYHLQMHFDASPADNFVMSILSFGQNIFNYIHVYIQ